MPHASNVTGAIQPAAEIGNICRQRGTRFLLDAAQTLGHLPVSVIDFNADLLAAPGHKGLLGPLGTGVLYVRPEIVDELQSTRQGGTGTSSDDERQPRRCLTNTNRAITMCRDWSAWRPRLRGSKAAALRVFVLTSNNWPCDCEMD